MDFINHINGVHTLPKELYAVFDIIFSLNIPGGMRL